LWSRLRNRQVANLKFAGNIHRYRTVDFFCAEAKLGIELDGSGHASHREQTSDLDREIELYEKGIRVLRFSEHRRFQESRWRLNAII